jgi:hypothetical protein
MINPYTPTTLPLPVIELGRKGEAADAGGSIGMLQVDLPVPDDELVANGDENVAQRFTVGDENVGRAAVQQARRLMAEHRKSAEGAESKLDVKFERHIAEKCRDPQPIRGCRNELVQVVDLGYRVKAGTSHCGFRIGKG